MSSDTSGALNDPQLRRILEAAGVWTWDADLVNDTTVYQPGFWEQYGYEPPQLADTFDFVQVVHTSDLQDVTRAWRAHLDGETEIYESRWRLRAADGSWRWIQSRGSVVERDAAGKPLRMLGAYTDVTDSLRAAADLASSNAELDAVFRSSPDGIVLVSPGLEVLRANAAALRIIEAVTGAEVRVGMNLAELPPTSADRPVLADIRAALAGAEVATRTIQGPVTGRWMELSYAQVHDVEGRVLGTAAAIRDVTERRHMEASRTQLARMESLGLMAGGIAHDFNNLLAVIVGNIDLAGLSPAEELDTPLNEARGAARRASELVRQLLTYAGRQEPEVQPVDLSALVREIVRYASRIPGHSVQIDAELNEELPLIEADSTQLRQLILNLLVNALDATLGEGKTITVRCSPAPNPRGLGLNLLMTERPAPSYVCLEVRDEGSGMDAATMEHIFDPFFSTKPTGHGLGLSSVFGSVRNHGGTLAVRSEPGKGSVFSVFLPAIGA
jgi:PAS domain S-box-containing protein